MLAIDEEPADEYRTSGHLAYWIRSHSCTNAWSDTGNTIKLYSHHSCSGDGALCTSKQPRPVIHVGNTTAQRKVFVMGFKAYKIMQTIGLIKPEYELLIIQWHLLLQCFIMVRWGLFESVNACFQCKKLLRISHFKTSSRLSIKCYWKPLFYYLVIVMRIF